MSKPFFQDDLEMKDMLPSLMAWGTVNQQQWLAVRDELGGHRGVLPIPNSFLHSQEQEKGEFNCVFLMAQKDSRPLTEVRWTSGPSNDGKSANSQQVAQPAGGEPQPAPPLSQAYARVEQEDWKQASA